jgi:rhodanese-related sulfurtransferase
MRTTASVVCRALMMVLIFAFIGMLSNLLSGKPVDWRYVPPEEMLLAGVKVQLIDAKAAHKYSHDSSTVFVDSRECRDYAKSHVKGAICLPPDDVEQRFLSVEPLIPPESRVILYCYGPECDMAEKVGTFLAQQGYKNMMIMSSGFNAWEKAKFPVDGTSKGDAAIEDPEDFWRQDEIADIEIASRRLCRCLGLFKDASARLPTSKREVAS